MDKEIGTWTFWIAIVAAALSIVNSFFTIQTYYANRSIEYTRAVRQAYAKWAGICFEWIGTGLALDSKIEQCNKMHNIVLNPAQQPSGTFPITKQMWEQAEKEADELEKRSFDLAYKLREAKACIFALDGDDERVDRFRKLQPFVPVLAKLASMSNPKLSRSILVNQQQNNVDQIEAFLRTLADKTA